VHQGDGVKIDDNAKAVFLSLENAIANAAPPRDFKRIPRAVLEGVSFAARVAVSADRRRVRLTIAQNTVEVLQTKKFLGFNPATAKVSPVTVPKLRETVAVESFDVDDGELLLIPMAKRSAQEPKDRQWVLLVQPIIYIEEEQKMLREGKIDAITAPEPAPKQSPQEKPRTLPRTSDVEQILHAVVKDVLTNRELKQTREFYGTPGDKHFILEDGSDVFWAKWFRPRVPGFELIDPAEIEVDNESPHVLGIRIDHFDLKGKSHSPFSAPIAICISNAGGGANGQVIGGCTVYYSPKRQGKGWSVECSTGSIDP